MFKELSRRMESLLWEDEWSCCHRGMKALGMIHVWFGLHKVKYSILSKEYTVYRYEYISISIYIYIGIDI